MFKLPLDSISCTPRSLSWLGNTILRTLKLVLVTFCPLGSTVLCATFSFTFDFSFFTNFLCPDLTMVTVLQYNYSVFKAVYSFYFFFTKTRRRRHKPFHTRRTVISDNKECGTPFTTRRWYSADRRRRQCNHNGSDKNRQRPRASIRLCGHVAAETPRTSCV